MSIVSVSSDFAVRRMLPGALDSLMEGAYSDDEESLTRSDTDARVLDERRTSLDMVPSHHTAIDLSAMSKTSRRKLGRQWLATQSA
jgi:hypothetical protein